MKRASKITASLCFIGGAYQVFFIWFETGGGPRALQPSPLKVKVKLHSGWTRHHRLPACRALSLKMCLRPQAKTCWIWMFRFFVCFFPLTAAAVHEKPCEAVKRLLLFPLPTNGGAFHGNQGAVTHKVRRKVRAKGSSPITSQVSLFFFCCQLRESSVISLISGGNSNGRSAVHVYRGGMDKQHRHVRCCAANKPPRWPHDSGYTWKWVKTRKARENAGDVAEDSWWRNCVYFKLQLFLLADLLHSASFVCFSHRILQCLMPDSGDFAKKRGRCY